jgi:hypothetical protein
MPLTIIALIIVMPLIIVSLPLALSHTLHSPYTDYCPRCRGLKSHLNEPDAKPGGIIKAAADDTAGGRDKWW